MTDPKKGESFAELFEKQAPVTRRKLKVGDRVKGVVAHVGPEAVFLDLGSQQQAFFERIDLAPPGEPLKTKVGDTLEGVVVEVDPDGQIRLARGFSAESGVSKDAAMSRIRLAQEERVPIEGKVTGVNKGGVEVDLAGVRAFCPISQLDNRFVEDPSTFIGQSLSFLVTEIRDRDVVLSRRSIREEESKKAREAALEGLEVGAVRKGRVTQLRDFGAFVDLGGIDGLIPLRELSHERTRPEDVVTVGDVVEVQVREVTREGDKTRITLSLKALSKDPWDGVATVAPIGKVISGQVSRIADFGAFVRIAPGIEGLLHVSELPANTKHPGDVLTIGQQMLVVAKSIDEAKRRIALVQANEGATPGQVAEKSSVVLGAVVKCKVEKIERFGLFVQLEGARGKAGRGLIPNAELVAKGTDVRREFPIGTELVAKVIETGEGRLRLSVRAAGDDAERAVYDQYRQVSAGQKMGSLGDLLRAKMPKK